jgi:hypothetical protein
MPILESLARSYRAGSPKVELRQTRMTYHQPFDPVPWPIDRPSLNEVPIWIKLRLCLKPVSGVGNKICSGLGYNGLASRSGESVLLVNRRDSAQKYSQHLLSKIFPAFVARCNILRPMCIFAWNNTVIKNVRMSCMVCHEPLTNNRGCPLPSISGVLPVAPRCPPYRERNQCR